MIVHLSLLLGLPILITFHSCRLIQTYDQHLEFSNNQATYDCYNTIFFQYLTYKSIHNRILRVVSITSNKSIWQCLHMFSVFSSFDSSARDQLIPLPSSPSLRCLLYVGFQATIGCFHVALVRGSIRSYRLHLDRFCGAAGKLLDPGLSVAVHITHISLKRRPSCVSFSDQKGCFRSRLGWVHCRSFPFLSRPDERFFMVHVYSIYPQVFNCVATARLPVLPPNLQKMW